MDKKTVKSGVNITGKTDGTPIGQREYSAGKNLFWILLISLFGTSLYFQSMKYDYAGDDEIYTFRNSAVIKGLHDVGDIFTHGSMYFYTPVSFNSGTYRPVTLLSFAAEKQIFEKFDASASHTINIVLYFLILLLAGLLLVRIFSLKSIPLLLPLLILLIWAVHPLHTEVVANIKSRDTLLAAFFSLLSVYTWLLSYKSYRIPLSIGAGVIFLLALLSKEDALTIIAVAALISYFFLGSNIKKSLLDTLPFVIPGIVYVAVRNLVLDPTDASVTNIYNSVIYGTHGWDRIATQFFIYLNYIKLLIIPHPLSIDYSYNQIPIKTISDPAVIFSILLFVSLIVISYKGLKKRSLFSFGILFFLSTFSIYANLTPSLTIASTLGERFLFIPSLGYSILLVYGLYKFSHAVIKSNNQAILMIIVMIAALLLTIKSYTRVPVWRNQNALTSSGVKDSPDNCRAHFIYALELQRQAQVMKNDTAVAQNQEKSDAIFTKAIHHYKKGFSIIGNKVRLRMFNESLGQCYLSTGDTAEAKKQFLLAAVDRTRFMAQFQLGFLSFEERNYADAINYYQKALKAHQPNYFLTYKNLGAACLKQKDFKQAISFYEKALEYDTSSAIRSNLTYLYTKTGNIEKADKLFNATAEITDSEKQYRALMNRGSTAFYKGEFQAAKTYFRQCSDDYLKYGGKARFPGYLPAWANCCMKTGDLSEAKRVYLKMAGENPGDYTPIEMLAFIAFNHEKNYRQAIQYYTKFLESGKNPAITYANLGAAYAMEQMPEKAIECYEKALGYGTTRQIVENLLVLSKRAGDKARETKYSNMLK